MVQHVSGGLGSRGVGKQYTIITVVARRESSVKTGRVGQILMQSLSELENFPHPQITSVQMRKACAGHRKRVKTLILDICILLCVSEESPLRRVG